MLRWLAGAPALNRMAFGVLLNLPVGEREIGYRTLSTLLPIRIDAAKSRDFLYQINRPRLASTPGAVGLEINCLSRWMVSLLARAKLTFTEASVGFFDRENVTSACRVEMDINTAGERQEALPRETYAGLFRELVEIACEIAEKGDVP
jgi:hypothetical protein